MTTTPPAENKPARLHRATFAKDKNTGGYNVRVVGPHCNKFAGREVPVTLKDGTEKLVTLQSVIWTGPDTDVKTKEPTGKQAALYSMVPTERETSEAEF